MISMCQAELVLSNWPVFAGDKAENGWLVYGGDENHAHRLTRQTSSFRAVWSSRKLDNLLFSFKVCFVDWQQVMLYSNPVRKTEVAKHATNDLYQC